MKKYFSSYWIRSAFYTIFHRFSVTLFGLINFMILIRSLSHQQMGTWALFLIVTTIFEATKTALLKNAHIRYVSGSNIHNERVEIASSSFMINVFISIVFITFIIFFSHWLSRVLHTGVDLANMLIYFIPGLIFMVLFSHFEAVQQSNFDFKGIFGGYIVRQIVFFLIILYHTIFKIPLVLKYLAVYQSISILLGVVVIFGYTRKYLDFEFKPSFAWVKKISGYGGYIFSSSVVSNVVSNIDQFMTATLLSSTYVTYYNAASRINSLIDIPSFAAADILFPKASLASVEEGPGKVKYLYERMVAILMCFTTPTVLFIIIFPHFVISVIAGKSYLAAIPILQLYMVGGILRPMQNQAANLLNSIGKPKLCFFINAFFLVINLPVNYFCLKTFGFYGAAIGTFITLVLSTTTWYFIMKKQIHFRVTDILIHMKSVYTGLFKNVSQFFSKRESVISYK